MNKSTDEYDEFCPWLFVPFEDEMLFRGLVERDYVRAFYKKPVIEVMNRVLKIDWNEDSIEDEQSNKNDEMSEDEN